MVEGPEHSSFPPGRRAVVSLFQDTTTGLVLLLALGFVIRAILAHANVYPSYDGTFYLNTARDLVALGQYYRSGFPPGFPLLVAPVLFNLGPSDPQAPLVAGQFVNVFSGTALVLLSYHLARREHSAGLAFGVAAVMAFLPLALRLSASDLSEPSFACFLLAGWILFSKGHHFRAGCLWGFAYLIRPEALLILALLAVWHLLHRRWAILRLLGGAALFILPYGIVLSLSSGQLQLSAKTSFLVRAAQQHPGTSFLMHYLGNARELLGLSVGTIGPVLSLLGLGGIVFRPRGWVVCLSPLLLLPAFGFRMDARYLLPFLPFLLLAALDGGLWLVDHTRAHRRWAAIALVALGLFSASLAGVQQRDLLRGNLEYFPAMRSAGLWLRERVDHEVIVAGRKPYVSYWAWCKYARIPDAMDLASIVEWCESNGCEYLVVHVGVTLGMAPALTPLLASPPEEFAGRLSLVGVFRIQGQPDETTLIYRVVEGRSS